MTYSTDRTASRKMKTVTSDFQNATEHARAENEHVHKRARGRSIAAAVVIASLLAVVLIQTVAQSDDTESAAADYVAPQGERVFLSSDGTYQVEIPGRVTSRQLPGSRGILLAREGASIPQLDSSGLRAAPDAESSDFASPFIVEFATQPLESYRHEIRNLGGTDGDYIPDHALLVLMAPTAVSTVEALPYVVAVSPYSTDYRSTTPTYASFADPTVREFAIKLFDGTEASRLPILDAVTQHGGTILSSSLGSSIVRVAMTGTAASQLLDHSRMQFIELVEPIESDTARERIVSGADYIGAAANGGYEGGGVTINLLDNGISETHEVFTGQSLVIESDSSVDGHGTATASVLISNGIARPDTRGIAPDATLVFTSYTVADRTRLQHAALVSDPAGPYRAILTLSPWGNGFDNGYGTLSAELDEAAFVHDHLTVQSMGNSSSNTFRPQASAKNVISVGGIGHRRNLDPSDDTYSPPDLPNLGGVGPVSDGRIKPDLHFWNDGTPAALHSSEFPGDDGYFPIGFDGTSASSTTTAGYMALLYDMWADGVFAGTPGLNRDVFDSRPHMATAKALAINTAAEYQFSSVSSDLNRYQQGWGRPDMGFAYDLATGGNIPILIDETDLLTPFATNTYTFDAVASPTCFMRTTLVYTDPAAAPGAITHRINDLSLRLTSPSGTIYWGNNGLTGGNDSTPGGVSNTVDTVENVFLTSLEAGTWTVDVIGDEIVADSHVETATLDADYALIASGTCIGDTPPPAGAITGTVWQDDNGDAANVGETGIAGVGVTLTDSGGTAAGSATTDSLGAFGFADLTPGTYTVAIDSLDLPADVAATFDPDGVGTAHTAAVTVTALANTAADFGYQVQLVAVGNRIFLDNDFSGDISTGDTGPPAPLIVELRDPAGTLVATTNTDADGFYLFDRLAPGQYRVTIPLSETIQGGGGAAEDLDSTVGAVDAEIVQDDDDNGFVESGVGIRTGLFDLSIGTEPINDPRGSVTPTVPDLNANMTIDIGLFPSLD